CILLASTQNGSSTPTNTFLLSEFLMWIVPTFVQRYERSVRNNGICELRIEHSLDEFIKAVRKSSIGIIPPLTTEFAQVFFGEIVACSHHRKFTKGNCIHAGLLLPCRYPHKGA